MNHKTRVGEIRPSQLMFTYGVGAIIDLPKLSVIVTGLEDWTVDPMVNKTIVEDRLLMAVRYELPEVKKLLGPPIVRDTGLPADPFEPSAKMGVSVATFPRWMVCPRCHLLAPLSSDLFTLKEHPYHPDRTVYRHENCDQGKSPEVVPARFLVACESGHLDDFPWPEFAHKGEICSGSRLRLKEYGPGGEARDLEVACDTCGARRRLSDAFGEENREKLPRCSARRPHLRDYDPDGCEHKVRPIILGASNTWFPVVLSTVAIPVGSGRLPQLVEEHWAQLQAVTAPNILQFLRSTGQLGDLSAFGDGEIWQAIETRRAQDAGEAAAPSEAPDLKTPEWQVFTRHDPHLNNEDFRLTPVAVPPSFRQVIDQVVLVERLREVRAMIGFTRIDAMGELTDPDLNLQIDRSPLSRQPSTWVPADEVRGEGIFIQFSEARINAWLARPAIHQRGLAFFESHKKWRQARRIEPPEKGFPGMRYVLIHTFAHALMRQLSLECGYAAASIRERLYVRPPESEGGPMAGLLIYTSAPDSEGTLGGLVSLGQPATLERHIAQALEAARLCASDPLCAERQPSQTGQTLHAAACHACLFAPETSCERGNKYLDRSTLVRTVEIDDLAFFE
ncbi:MAG TPA: DUF1998 domain-containing protein [Anaerolineae bacterium]|nr:DUF1998 domain-containing protein [Anaerolineae bacterium]